MVGGMTNKTAQLSGPTVKQAADAIGCHPDTIRRAIARGEITAYRLGPRMLRVNADSLTAWATGQPIGGGAA